jgi:protein gp37
MLAEPFRWRKPQRVFVNSMSDLFHESLSNEEIAAVFGVMGAAKRHTFMILTKRPERARAWFRWVEAQPTNLLTIPTSASLTCAHAAQAVTGEHWTVAKPHEWPFSNVWLGASTEDQKTADDRIPDLLHCPAAVHFISAEPLLGPLDVRRYLEFGAICECATDEPKHDRCEGKGPRGWIRCKAGLTRLKWIIGGSESGHGARACDPKWIGSLAEQCASVKGVGTKRSPVAFFTKQIATGSNGKGGDPATWPAGEWPRQFPEVRP